jgi:excisionase family DNA binding protein
MAERMLTLDQVAEELNVSYSQVYALVRRRDLRALKIGGRGVYRVGRSVLEEFISGLYAQTAEWLAQHPFTDSDADWAPEEDVGTALDLGQD